MSPWNPAPCAWGPSSWPASPPSSSAATTPRGGRPGRCTTSPTIPVSITGLHCCRRSSKPNVPACSARFLRRCGLANGLLPPADLTEFFRCVDVEKRPFGVRYAGQLVRLYQTGVHLLQQDIEPFLSGFNRPIHPVETALGVDRVQRLRSGCTAGGDGVILPFDTAEQPDHLPVQIRHV